MARNIMIQGTMSNAGKSFLTAALCRVFWQDGYRTVPFKSQNMALNSFVTADGLEMGRAQVMQAEAAGAEPDVRMNPVLLKPATDTGSQVIVNGRVRGQYSAREYFARKKELIPEILAAYRSLEKEADIIVIEGAGSPAEINLKSDDIVNMGLAGLVDAPVLLVGDIDPGGVFAQLYGTVMLLEPEERSRIRGLIINKFRGDASLLDPGISMLEERLGIPVLGTIPYMDIELDDEDSMSGQLTRRSHTKPVDIAVIRLPRISNFTDFTPLQAHSLLGVRYVSTAAQLGDPDLVILPGTKSTLEDLRWLRGTGLADAVIRLAGGGTRVLGVCGGYQMLGMLLSDPEGCEGAPSPGPVRGLGLLPVETVFERQKSRKQTKMRIRDGFLTGSSVYGYEIHMGRTMAIDAQGPAVARGSDRDAEVSAQTDCAHGNVYGTYLHGLFDSGEAVDRLAEVLAKEKGLEVPQYRSTDRAGWRQTQYDALAEALRKHIDMDRIYRIMGTER